MMEVTSATNSTPFTPPNITLVTILSFCIPGLGQFGNREIGKGLAMLALWLVLACIWMPLILILCCFSAWDAYTAAKNLHANVDQTASDLAKVAEGQVSAEYMVTQFDKLNNLSKANLLTADELTDRKAKVIALLEKKKPASSVEDFLTALIPLVKSEGLSSDEIASIKALLLR